MFDQMHKGPVIGYYLDYPIFEYVHIGGAKYCYDRVAHNCSSAEAAVSQLKNGETVIEPGLIYTRSGGNE